MYKDLSTVENSVDPLLNPALAIEQAKRQELAQLTRLVMWTLFAFVALILLAWAYHDRESALTWVSSSWTNLQAHWSEWSAAKPAATQAVTQAATETAAVVSNAASSAGAAQAAASAVAEAMQPTPVVTPDTIGALGHCSLSDPQVVPMAQALVNLTDSILGKMLAMAMLLMGGAVAVAKANPMPALTGIAGATMLAFGPSIILGTLGC